MGAGSEEGSPLEPAPPELHAVAFDAELHVRTACLLPCSTTMCLLRLHVSKMHAKPGAGLVLNAAIKAAVLTLKSVQGSCLSSTALRGGQESGVREEKVDDL